MAAAAAGEEEEKVEQGEEVASGENLLPRKRPRVPEEKRRPSISS